MKKNLNKCPSIFYGTKNTSYNYVSNVSFTKTNSPNLREARYFNSNYGNLSLLSNVYDLSFTLFKRKANTVIYPGNIINFVLMDWGTETDDANQPWKWLTDENYSKFGDSWPHTVDKEAHLLGLGGYFVILSTEYKLGEEPAEFEITYNTKFLGTDADPDPSSNSTEVLDATTQAACNKAFDVIATRYNSLADSDDEVIAYRSTTQPSPPANNTNPPPAQPVPAVTVTYADQVAEIIKLFTGVAGLPMTKKTSIDSAYTKDIKSNNSASFNRKGYQTIILTALNDIAAREISGTSGSAEFIYETTSSNDAFNVYIKFKIINSNVTITEIKGKP